MANGYKWVIVSCFQTIQLFGDGAWIKRYLIQLNLSLATPHGKKKKALWIWGSRWIQIIQLGCETHGFLIQENLYRGGHFYSCLLYMRFWRSLQNEMTFPWEFRPISILDLGTSRHSHNIKSQSTNYAKLRNVTVWILRKSSFFQFFPKYTKKRSLTQKKGPKTKTNKH